MKLKILENFLEKEDLDKIRQLNLEKINNNSIKVYHNKIYKNGETQADCFTDKEIKEFHSKYHTKALNILKELNPLKVDLYDYSEFHIIETGANCSFPIHDDTPDKLLSGVIYIRPDKNTGTIFYDNKKGDGKQEVEWKVNRGVFFSRIEGETWHSYEGDQISNRIVLVYNLMTKKIKDVYRVENKNYFFGRFRYWINPYLYKFLKFTI